METDKIPDISIIDYGVSNLKSVKKAFEKLNKTCKIIDSPEEVRSAKCLILPGVGAFKDGIDGLKKRGLMEPLKESAADGVPILGICLGMQMLFSESEEFGLHRGLGLIGGRVIPFMPPNAVDINGYRVPHMGWNELIIPTTRKGKQKWKGTLLEDIIEHSDVYFVHSFYPVPDDPDEIIATTRYGNQEFCAVVKKENITGTQFHPEKSGIVGLKMLKKFCELHKIGT